MTNLIKIFPFILCSSLLIISCNEEVVSKIDSINSRLDKIEKKLNTMAADMKNVKAPERPQRKQPDFNKVYKIPVAKANSKGAKDPLLTIVEFSDFQCPFCAKTAPDLDQVVAKYPNEVKLVFKHFPLSFHKNAKPAAIAANAAGRQGKFWEMHDLLFKNFRTLSKESIDGFAKEIGLDMAKFNNDINDSAIAKEVDQDIADGRNAEVTGTPTIYVNGKRAKSRGLSYFEEELKKLRGKKG